VGDAVPLVGDAVALVGGGLALAGDGVPPGTGDSTKFSFFARDSTRFGGCFSLLGFPVPKLRRLVRIALLPVPARPRRFFADVAAERDLISVVSGRITPVGNIVSPVCVVVSPICLQLAVVAEPVTLIRCGLAPITTFEDRY
jgi:hypothetical protein